MKNVLRYLVVVAIGFPGLAFGQKTEADHTHLYKVDVTLIESENGKAINTRTYTMLINDHDTGRVRQGERIPVAAPSAGSGKDAGSSQTQYIDVGLNLDCRLAATNDGLTLNTSIDMSSLAPDQTQNTSGNPIIRQQRYQTASLVQPGKQIAIMSLDQYDSKRRMQIEALLTRIQ